MFLRFFRNPARHLNWLEMGGEETLKSYSIDIGRYLGRRKDMAGLRAIMKERIPEQHLAFLDKLYISLKVGKFLFVHAGIKPGLPIQQQTDHDLMWIREPFLSEGSGSPLTVVHGHTMTMEPVFGNKRIGIDTGAYMTGRLSAVRIFNDVCEVL
ncbi:hypothetical protein C8J36_102584 [Rhizobium sp. PP-F2F-G48]|nr:hypothetical protein C8J36_102584 [Rhizobium sp. PP-F2F-G48]